MFKTGDKVKVVKIKAKPLLFLIGYTGTITGSVQDRHDGLMYTVKIDDECERFFYPDELALI